MHRHLIGLVLTLAIGCVFGTEDDPPIVDPPCTGTPALCVDDCCERTESPFYDAVCTPSCSFGLRLISGFSCDPLPVCFDGGTPPPPDGGGCGAVDAGAVCLGGECCDDAVHGRTDPVTCRFECPPGYDVACVPEPSCEANTPCNQPSDCTLTNATCCGTCETPTLDDVVGVHDDDLERYEELVCRVPEECPPCVVADPNPNLVATCNATECRAVDIARISATECSGDEDCRLRTATCCECDVVPSSTTVVAVRTDAIVDLLSLTCDDGAACDACVPDYPSDLEAFCDAGRCTVRELP